LVIVAGIAALVYTQLKDTCKSTRPEENFKFYKNGPSENVGIKLTANDIENGIKGQTDGQGTRQFFFIIIYSPFPYYD
jgi:hypothetical protein